MLLWTISPNCSCSMSLAQLQWMTLPTVISVINHSYRNQDTDREDKDHENSLLTFSHLQNRRCLGERDVALWGQNYESLPSINLIIQIIQICSPARVLKIWGPKEVPAMVATPCHLTKAAAHLVNCISTPPSCLGLACMHCTLASQWIGYQSASQWDP